MEWINSFPVFLLIFFRITCFFITVPIFMMRTIPASFKIGLSFFLAILVFISTGQEAIVQPFSGEYLLLIFKECVIGLGLGLIASIMFYAIQLAGTFIDLQTGFAMAAVFDPQSGTNMNLTGRFKNVIGTLFFLSVDGHHLLLQGVLESYYWVSVDALVPAFFDGRISSLLLDTFKRSFLIAFLIAAPIVFTLFLVDVVLGIIGKTSPQINLMVVGFSVKMVVHFIILLLVIPGFFLLLNTLFSQMFESMSNMIRMMGAS